MLYNFFIIHPPLCKYEGNEEKKILFYYPSAQTTTIQQLKDIGLAEALNEISKNFSGTCEALRTHKYTHAFLEPEPNFLISLVIKNGDSAINYALLSSVVSDWYELFYRIYGRMTDLISSKPIDELKVCLADFFTSCLHKMPLHSYSLPELFRSFQFSTQKSFHLDVTYLLSRLQSRFCPLEGYLYFHQNFVLTSNIDRQTVYILMLYLNNMINDYDNGFLDLSFHTFFLPILNESLSLFVYHRQSQILVFLVKAEHASQFDRDQVKIFLDKNLSLKCLESADELPKDCIHYYVCNDTNGLSTENMFTYSNGEKQPRIHPAINSLVVEFQQTYLIPNGGEVSAQTDDDCWILTKSQNNRTAVFVNRHAKDKNLSDVTAEIDKLAETKMKNVITFESNHAK